MFEITVLELARLQFAFTISFHILFPALTIGLASFLALLEGLWLKTGNPAYRDLFLFWVKGFAVAFGMGVVSGVVMSYQFGTNWSEFSRFAGGVTGPLLAYEVMTAFFLEAGFLGIMLFGWNRVGPWLHFGATLMVALGTLLSMFWILASNSWMHTPAGFAIQQGRVVPLDWWAVVFNPSFPYRLTHMAIASFLTSALVVAATSAWHLLQGRRDERVKTGFSMALWLILLLAPVQIVVGDLHGLNTLRHQPVKIAAIEGFWRNEPEGMSLLLFGMPDMQAETTHFPIAVPHLGSIILTHSWSGQIQPLTDFAAADRPNALILFWSFRVMVGLGLLMLVLGVIGLWLRQDGRLYEQRGFHYFAVAMGPSGLLALLAGWITTEVGRQPWLIYGLMRTSAGISPTVAMPQVGLSLLIFVVAYFVVFGAGFYYLLRLLRQGSLLAATPESGGVGQFRTPMRPLSAIEQTPDSASGERHD